MAPGGKGCGPAVYSFGGSNETFNFADPTNHLNLENDVWRYAPPVPPHHSAPRRPHRSDYPWARFLPRWMAPGLPR